MSNKEKVDVLIHARWVVPIVPSGVYHDHHSVAIKNGVITAILPTAEAEAKYTSDQVILIIKMRWNLY